MDNNNTTEKLNKIAISVARVEAKLDAHIELNQAIKEDLKELEGFSNKAKGVLGLIFAASSIAALKALFF